MELDFAAPCTLNLIWRSDDARTFLVWHTTFREAIDRFMTLDEEVRAEAWIFVKRTKASGERRLAPDDIRAYAPRSQVPGDSVFGVRPVGAD
jgi:hypothetical protein